LEKEYCEHKSAITHLLLDFSCEQVPDKQTDSIYEGQTPLAMFIPVNGGQGISRPFVVGLILLLVFLGMQSDLVPSRPESSTEEAEAPAKDVTKERVCPPFSLFCPNMQQVTV
jgi:hypothetical protein